MKCYTIKFTGPSRCEDLFNFLQMFSSVKLHSLLSHCHWRIICCLGNGINANHCWITTHLNIQPVCVGENEFRGADKDASRQKEIAWSEGHNFLSSSVGMKFKDSVIYRGNIWWVVMETLSLLSTKVAGFFHVKNPLNTYIYTHTPTQHFHVALSQRVNSSPSRMCLLQRLHKWRKNKKAHAGVCTWTFSFSLCSQLFIWMLVKLSVVTANGDDKSLKVDWLICSLWFWERLLDHF